MTKQAPLEHENLELKNGLLNSARRMWDSGVFENKLASLIIYTSFAEYLAEHLLVSVRFAVEKASYQRYGGILHSLTQPKQSKKSKRSLNMGDYISRLEGYDFPDKQQILPLLKNIAKARNDLFHNFARIKPEESKKLDEYSSSIHDDTEELINRINIVEATIGALTDDGFSSGGSGNEN